MSNLKFLGSTLLKGDVNTTVKTETLDDVPLVALYFSAHWCPPCGFFTPQLRDFYNAINKNEKRLEIVWVSSDEDEEEFEEYFEDMPWLAVPYESEENEDLREEISEKFSITAIPQLFVLNKDGTIKKNVNAKNDVENVGTGAFETWLA